MGNAGPLLLTLRLTAVVLLLLRDLQIVAPRPVDKHLRSKAPVADLHDHAGCICGVSLADLLEVGVREVNVTDEQFLALRLHEIADVVGVLREDEDAAGDELRDRGVQREAQACDAGPESLGVFHPVLVEEVA